MVGARRRVRALLALLGVFGATTSTGCTPAPVRAFEDFYAATVRKDGSAVRALLCGEAREAIASVDDATLLSTFAVQRVVRSARLAPTPPAADGAVDVVVEDAVGASTRVTLRPEGVAPGGWCIVGVGDPSPSSAPSSSALSSSALSSSGPSSPRTSP